MTSLQAVRDGEDSDHPPPPSPWLTEITSLFPFKTFMSEQNLWGLGGEGECTTSPDCWHSDSRHLSFLQTFVSLILWAARSRTQFDNRTSYQPSKHRDASVESNVTNSHEHTGLTTLSPPPPSSSYFFQLQCFLLLIWKSSLYRQNSNPLQQTHQRYLFQVVVWTFSTAPSLKELTNINV